MYSAVCADVPMEDDPSTQLNRALIEELATHDKILVCGQAMSHCVNFTLRDIVGHVEGADVSKFVLLRDGASAVPGFEEQATAFVADMEAKGVQISDCKTQSGAGD
mmetsp:Transcript_16086/g.61358  ORF Transcript_16086/g.61358 Transcript_16086/m.61358 type:complete len:106 (-) Transcript_16086:415-732(-)